MQIKKSREVELERKKPTLYLLGLAVACAVVLSAFEWRTPMKERSQGDDLGEEIAVIEATIMQVSFRKKEKPVEKKEDVKKEVAKTVIDQFKLSDNELAIDDIAFPDIDDEPTVEEISQLTEEVFEEKIWPVADVMPEFPGGDSSRVVFLQNQVKYPRMAKDAGISGTVHVGF
ncbi:MAG TPA: hypothetical protein VJ949_11610, partial [Cryomorphaceae bacterium]|nr:hypothetical protein [Cryomorphaceae bacterium]